MTQTTKNTDQGNDEGGAPTLVDENIAFAANMNEAEARAEACSKKDPYPEIPPSLLSSYDVARYVRQTGMLLPFNEKKLKSASYEIRPGGQFIYWQKIDGKVRPFEETITAETKSIILPANSISYVQSEAYFRLPFYIAVRFNLRIKHVHRGILLGTGPIVDPGFAGKLLIPIHNLTSTEYVLNLTSTDEDDGLIWAEFTKTTYKPETDNGLSKFDKNKKDKSPKYYLNAANGGNPILSSIHDGIEEAKVQAEEAKKQAEVMAVASAASEKTLRNYGFFAVVGVVLSVAALTYSGYSVAQGSLSVSLAARQSADSAASRSQQDEADIKDLQKRLDVEVVRNKALKASLDALDSRTQAIERRTAPKLP